MQGAVAVDHQHPAVTRFGQYGFQKRVVLEALDGRDAPCELRPTTELPKLQIAAADGGADLVDEVGGGAWLDGHPSMLGEKSGIDVG